MKPDRAANPEPMTPAWLRRTLVVSYVFLVMWLVTGFLYLYYAAISGEVLRAAITAAVTLAGAGAVLVILTLLRIGLLLVRNATTLECVYERMGRLEVWIERRDSEVNLSALGAGDPQPLVAGTLTTGSFPRLVRCVPQEAEPPVPTHDKGAPTSASSVTAQTLPAASTEEPSRNHPEPLSTEVEPALEPLACNAEGQPAGERSEGPPYSVGVIPEPSSYSQSATTVAGATVEAQPARSPVEGPTVHAGAAAKLGSELETEWMRAFEKADVVGCRQILERANGKLPSERVYAMRAWLESALQDRKEGLRRAFGDLVRQGHYTEALATGAEIAKTFPDSTLAAQFARIEPHLRERAWRCSVPTDTTGMQGSP